MDRLSVLRDKVQGLLGIVQNLEDYPNDYDEDITLFEMTLEQVQESFNDFCDQG